MYVKRYCGICRYFHRHSICQKPCYCICTIYVIMSVVLPSFR